MSFVENHTHANRRSGENCMYHSAWFLTFFTLLACLIGSLFGCGSSASAPPAVPSLSGAVIGPKELVFDTRSGCEQIDIPDAPARAFRDDHGVVHLVATHFVARAMIGPSLNR